MESVDILVIGAGVVGLAIGRELAKCDREVVVVDKEGSFGRQTSSRNSEVIHSGIYYPPNSLKAKLCVQGNDLIYRYAYHYDIPHRNTGKLVVANSDKEVLHIHKLKENGEQNKLENLAILDEFRCRDLEPKIKAKQALYVPSTGIIDTHTLMHSLYKEIESEHGFVVFDMHVVHIDFTDNFYIVTFDNGDSFKANVLVNSGGLFSDHLARLVGIEIDKHNLRLHWCKGEYYKTTAIDHIEHLIYPTPDPDGKSLGIHLTLNLNKEVRFGPNAYYVDNLDYSMDEKCKSEFLSSINRYLDVQFDDIHPDDCGIRPKLQKEGDSFRDFYIREETDKGYPNFINCIGIESPGLTASLAIGKYVSNLIKQ